MIDIKKLTTGYYTSKKKIIIAENINASIAQGEFICLLGPNGAGKTTLMRTIAGFIPALSGNIYINDKDISTIKQNEMSKLLGVVLTEKPNVSSMSVEQLIGLGRSPYTGFWGRINNDDKKTIEKAIEETGIVNLKSRLVDTLSDGERQKVMIAKALAQSTPIILLDEPTAFLDFPSKADTMRLLARLAHEKDKCILQSTHDLNMALTLADKIWLLDRTQEFIVGSPRELADSRQLELFFKGEGITFDREKISFSVEP